MLAGRYRLEREIARGGMATVWLAVDQILDRQVAAKVLHDNLAADPVFRERFRVEAVAAARLTHPNIVAVFDTGEDEGRFFIVMEYLAGGTLKDAMSDGPMGYGRAARIGAEVCEALSYAHDSGVIHRDIKPANILFSENGHTKVGDFGIAKAAFVQSDLTDTGALLGTVRYLAPEQVQGEEPDGRADLYSLGVVLYEAVTGRSPFTGESDLMIATARIGTVPVPPRDIKPDVPRALNSAIMRALAPSLEDRFIDAGAFARSLLEEAEDQASSSQSDIEHTAPIAPVPQTSFVRSETRWLVPTMLIVILAGAIVAGYLTGFFQDLIGRTREATAEPVPIVAGGTFDPRPGDGSENDRKVPAAFDNDSATAWPTASYRRPNLGGLKEGVGIWVDLGSAVEVSALRVESITAGWVGAVRHSDDGQNWSPAPTGETAEKVHTFRVVDAGAHRYWMIWVTNLVTTSGQGTSSRPYSVGITEIDVLGG